MAGEELIHGDGALERQKTTKTSSEYRKTESESHEVERGGDYEKRVTSGETRESSVTGNETVKIRRGAGQACQPDSLPADWPATLPDQIVHDLLDAFYPAAGGAAAPLATPGSPAGTGNG